MKRDCQWIGSLSILLMGQKRVYFLQIHTMSQQLAAECVSIHNVRSRCQLKPHIVIGSHNHGLCRQFSWSDMRAIPVVDCVEVMLIRCHSAVMVPSMMVVESLFVVPYLAGVSVST